MLTRIAFRHCERSEAISKVGRDEIASDCVASQ
jgi:hypothetical protein